MKLQIQTRKNESDALLKLSERAKVKALPRLAKAWGSAAQEVLGRAVKNRFTGKGPFAVALNKLGVVTNRLRRSMRSTAPQVNSGTVSVSMGSNVSYYAGHEFGFRGRVQVKGHTRKASAKSSETFRGRLTRGAINDAKNRILIRGRSNYSYVRPHSRRVNIPARRPLGTELESIQTRLTFRQKLSAAIRLLTSRNS